MSISPKVFSFTIPEFCFLRMNLSTAILVTLRIYEGKYTELVHMSAYFVNVRYFGSHLKSG
jgi:hypothetical protein